MVELVLKLECEHFFFIIHSFEKIILIFPIFSPIDFRLSITLYCVFGLKEISINLKHYILAENYQYIYLLIYFLQCVQVWIKLSGKLQILLIIYSAYLACCLNVEEGRKIYVRQSEEIYYSVLNLTMTQ